MHAGARGSELGARAADVRVRSRCSVGRVRDRVPFCAGGTPQRTCGISPHPVHRRARALPPGRARLPVLHPIACALPPLRGLFSGTRIFDGEMFLPHLVARTTRPGAYFATCVQQVRQGGTTEGRLRGLLGGPAAEARGEAPSTRADGATVAARTPWPLA